MNDGVYIALSGAKIQELKLETASNNLANISTSGYKADVLTSKSFQFDLDTAIAQTARKPVKITPADILRENEMNPEVKYRGTYAHTGMFITNFSQGQHVFTGNPLNLSLEGPGFIAVETPQGTRYTRNSFYDLNSDGELVTSNGYKVRGDGLSSLGTGIISVNSNGDVSVDGNPSGKIDVVEFDNIHSLRKEGDNIYAPTEGDTVEKDPENTFIKQGYVEKANIQVVKEMVNLIEINRLYEAYQKMIISMDETTKKLLNQVAA